MAVQELHLRDPVVVGVAFGERDAAALAFGVELARVTGAPLALVHAYPYEALVAVAPPRWEREMRDAARARLDELAAPLRVHGEVHVDARADPSPVRALHEAAEELGASVLVVGVHDGHAVPGGVGERLLHAAPCAVVVVPAGQSPGGCGLQRIGVAFADGPEGADALAIAAGLARDAGGRIRTLTVADPGREARAKAIACKARGLLPAELIEACEVLEGTPAKELLRASRELDLLICGSRGYGPVRSLILGGVSRELAHDTSCPLLVVPRAPLPGVRISISDPVGLTER
jgi:nucleotide-binding universal stress UspA family protein